MPSDDETKDEGSSPSLKIMDTELPTTSGTCSPISDQEVVVLPLEEELPNEREINNLLTFFIKNTYSAIEDMTIAQISLEKCIDYMKRDYVVIEIDNSDGVLSTHYPSTIPYIIGETGIPNPNLEDLMSSDELHELLGSSRRARYRERFPVPVIHFNGTSICRSSTLAGSAENEAGESDARTWKAVTDLQTADIALLKQLSVRTIVDLMVEKKKLKLGVPVTSSEKVDKENRYHSHFNLLSLPFPGSEFFKEFHDNNYIAEGLRYDWSQPMCDAELFIPEDLKLDQLNINWSEYKEWDIVQMTQNYIKYILKYTQERKEGVLIHSISGWDRTPLFVSLIRMSLWADGVIHKSLNIAEMLFFTLAYDWMLFGHDLGDRLSKNEDNLLFCFNVLKHLIDDQFSVNPRPAKKRLSSCVCSSDSEPSPKKHCASSCVSCDDPDTISEATVERVPPIPECIVVADDSVDFLGSFPFSNILLAGFRSVIVCTKCILSKLKGEAGPSHDCRLFQQTLPVVMKSTSTAGSSQAVCGKSSRGSADDFSRNGRLTNIRRLFYRCYYQSLTDKHVNYSNVTMLKNIIQNLNEITNLK